MAFQAQVGMDKVLEALGIKGQFVRRIVIDLEVGSAIKVYIERFAEKEQIEGVAKALTNTNVEVVEVAGLTVEEPESPSPKVAFRKFL